MEIYILLGNGYPSIQAPLFYVAKTESSQLFYEAAKNFLYEKLGEKWQEDSIILYECVYLIQDEFINGFIESDSFNC